MDRIIFAPKSPIDGDPPCHTQSKAIGPAGHQLDTSLGRDIRTTKLYLKSSAGKKSGKNRRFCVFSFPPINV